MVLKYAHQYLQSAKQIMLLFDGSIPLTAFLKKYFSENKKFGSKDRKNISQLCYAVCRIGKAGIGLSWEDQFKIALFLSSDSSDAWGILYDDNWLSHFTFPIPEKLIFIKKEFEFFNQSHIFSFGEYLSNQIDKEKFSLSHLQQPDVYLRIRPGKKEFVCKQLEKAAIQFSTFSETCISIPPASKIDQLFIADREVVVQDRSSQQIGELLKLIEKETGKAIQFWDCCAASGGKTILAKDILGVLDITVSDIRSSIMHNLRARFERAGIKHFQTLITDLSSKNALKPSGKYNLVIADVPCTGSGTWGRTPEQLIFFKESSIGDFEKLQKQIVDNIVDSIAVGGYLLYSTCSVFKNENENLKDYFLNRYSNFKLIKESYCIGYEHKADSLYAVLFIKENN